jgi:hypothetical protein
MLPTEIIDWIAETFSATLFSTAAILVLRASMASHISVSSKGFSFVHDGRSEHTAATANIKNRLFIIIWIQVIPQDF